MAEIDKRLENSATVTQTNENFNRVLAIIDNGSGGGGGTGGGALIVHDNDGTLDKTYNEIKTALKSGILVLLVYVDGYGENELCVCAQISKAVPLGGNGFAVGCVDLEIVTTPYTTNIWVYISETENGYPVYADR